MKKYYANISNRVLSGVIFVWVMLFCNIGWAGDTGNKDILAAAIRGQVQGTFGPGSTVAYFIYIGEIFLAVVMYSKTRNIFAFLLAGIVLILTVYLFSLKG